MEVLDFKKNYPNGVEYSFPGIYEMLIKNKGYFIDLFYTEFDTTNISAIYLEFKNDTIYFNVIEIFPSIEEGVKHRIFIVTKTNFQLISNSYLPILSTIKKYNRISKIEEVV